MKRPLTSVIVLAACLAGMGSPRLPDEPENPLLASWERHREMRAGSEFGLEWIPVGPVMNSARAACVQGDPTRPGTLYAAFGPGGLWKTTDNGLTWKPIFENQPAPGIGDVALAPSRPETIWLGTGVDLKKPRNFTMPGTGVFRSDDGGASWRALGLGDSYHIGKIDVHPEDPDIAFVAVHGHYWTTNPHRGLYRTLDGGETWEHVLFVNERTGANDVVIAPSDPSIVYATTWENHPGVSGPSSGVWKSEDAGKTWRRLSGGLPDGPRTGRIGVAVSASDPAKAYVLVDNLNKSETGAAEVYRTTDGGRPGPGPMPRVSAFSRTSAGISPTSISIPVTTTKCMPWASGSPTAGTGAGPSTCWAATSSTFFRARPRPSTSTIASCGSTPAIPTAWRSATTAGSTRASTAAGPGSITTTSRSGSSTTSRWTIRTRT
jgi:photosystem II stability/assembly factor-like uncharacterized protein